MKDYQVRVIGEKEYLDEKLGKLTAFANSAQFVKLPMAEQARLHRQLGVMQQYSGILGERIEAFS